MKRSCLTTDDLALQSQHSGISKDCTLKAVIVLDHSFAKCRSCTPANQTVQQWVCVVKIFPDGGSGKPASPTVHSEITQTQKAYTLG